MLRRGNTQGQCSTPIDTLLMIGDKLYELLLEQVPQDDARRQEIEHWVAHDLWAIQSWEQITDYFSRHRHKSVLAQLLSPEPKETS